MSKFCPICVLISSIWLLITIGLWLGFLESLGWQLAAAVAMGGSVVGIAYQKASRRWKVSVISLGLPVAYLLVSRINALSIGVEILLLSVFAYILFFRKEISQNRQTGELEEKLKNCC